MPKQSSKRRNTMNSRDAAFDENLKEILETTAAEAGATHDPAVPNGNGHPEVDEDGEPTPPNRKKRKRTEDDASVLIAFYYATGVDWSADRPRNERDQHRVLRIDGWPRRCPETNRRRQPRWSQRPRRR